MGTIKNNIIWNFFKSVKLALFTFFTLAITSIIGTVIQQNEDPAVYVREYGATAAKLFHILGITDMYNAWWFIGLLILFSINLIVCSLNRFPDTWRLVVMDNLAIAPERLGRMRSRASFISGLAANDLVTLLEQGMAAAGWKPRKGTKEGGGVRFVAQKGAWTRLGVYMVHLSILVIFVGAIIGSLFGYKASLMLPMKGTSDIVYVRGSNMPKKLGFTIRCDDFDISYYDNGAPKEYRSQITILEDGKEKLSHSLIVNDPLDYKGLTFYQASYKGFDEFLITIKNQTTQEERIFRVPPLRKIIWPESGITFGIVNYQPPNPWGEYGLKIWFSDGKGAPSEFLLDGSRPVVIERADTSYLMSSKQFFATGLQIAKDPGVWYVYVGCIMMLLGLAMAFFLSHKRIWLLVTGDGNRSRLLVSGASNKNKVGFERDFDALVAKLTQNEKLQLGEE
jgi:cytochrome c biogenesis protein